ncbi:MAG TPA: PBP1A family penicillin-binding protein [Vicinamibacterales bacterium]|nr:PBP1A family penicillin-binding protein [Vicinamibacterales bacterium]
MSFLVPIRARFHALLTGRPRFLTGLVGVMAVVLFLVSGYATWLAYDITAGLPNRDRLREMGDMAQSTTLFDIHDKPVFTIFKEQRIEVPFEKMSPNLIKAVVSVEDQRFYEHTGVDAVRVAAAVVRNFQEGRRAEGGSTITQQLARQTFLSRDKTYRRKLKEVIVAAYIENVYEKQDIIELYLNKVYFGDGLHGVEAASRGYFAKSASELTLEEGALLAGLIQSPSTYAPTVNLEGAVARRNVVLQSMVSSGAIDQKMADRAKRAEVTLANGLEIRETFGLYFKEQVRRELVERFGWQRVYQGGLRVYTTMDAELQQTAEALVEKGLVELEKRPGFRHQKRGHTRTKKGQLPAYVQGALVSMDPSNGHVLALVGGRHFGESRFNRATQAKRQSGSAFKPFVYAAALEAGHSPATVLTRLNDPIRTAQGAWVPEDGHSKASSMTLRTALKISSNRAAVKMLTTVGIPAAVAAAEKLNVGTPPSVPSLALGASDVTLLSLTAAYGAFASAGIVRQPVLLRRVDDNDGETLYTDEKKSHRAVSEATAFMMSSMLADVINHGTGYRVRQSGFTLPAAGKTGTTNDYVDAWFVGFTPRVVTGVWVGFDQPSTIIANGYGGELAVPIWAGFMKEATKGHEGTWFERPAGVAAVNVCRASGKLPNDGCSNVEVVTRDGWAETRSMVYTEFFRKGTEPRSVCQVHNSFFEGLTGVSDDSGDASAPRQPRLPDQAMPEPPPSDRISGGVLPGGPGGDKKEKKGGFWSNVFGDGKGDDKKKNDQKPPEKKKPGGG